MILDELGRGTSTFDGTAIAFAVAQHISQEIRCRAMFSTHYHTLTRDLKHENRVSMYHMCCLVDPKTQDVLFLHKFVKGVAEQSFGMNVARLAGLPSAVTVRAREMSAKFERDLNSVQMRQELKTICGSLKNLDAAALRGLLKY